MNSQADIYYRRIVKDPSWVNTISEAWRLLILEHAYRKAQIESLHIQKLIIANPEFKYPDPNNKFEYWNQDRKMIYTEACKVISDIEQSLAPPVETSTPPPTIVEPYLLKVIFEKYGHHFEGETLGRWVQRFSDFDITVPPIKVRADAREGSDRLILLAILSSVHKTTGNGFPFARYVENHFGIKAFDSAKSRNNEKVSYREVMKDCDRILKVTTM